MKVRLIVDIHEENELSNPIVVPYGTVFEWDEESEFQRIDGELIYIDRHEVEEVK